MIATIRIASLVSAVCILAITLCAKSFAIPGYSSYKECINAHATGPAGIGPGGCTRKNGVCVPGGCTGTQWQTA
jgi:hypothetical protein